MIEQIKFQQFRNLKDLEVQFDTHANIVIEPNGTGKSNFLEGIYLLSTGFSPRTTKMKEAIMWSSKFARVEGVIEGTPLAVYLTSGQRQYQVNSSAVSLPKFINRLSSVFFQPSDLNLLTGSPTTRRLYLNRMIGQVDYEYLFALQQQRKLLKQRNALLKQARHDNSVLDIIEAQLSDYATFIYRRRFAVINELNTLLEPHSTSLSYVSSPQKVLDLLRERSDNSAGIIAEYLREKMRELREKEKALGFSLIGPQRDDVIVYVSDGDHPSGRKNIGVFGSRGQQRMAVIRLKIAEGNLLEQRTKKKPVLLLDDVFSELDKANQTILFENVINNQYIITSTDSSIFPAYLTQNSRILIA